MSSLEISVEVGYPPPHPKVVFDGEVLYDDCANVRGLDLDIDPGGTWVFSRETTPGGVYSSRVDLRVEQRVNCARDPWVLVDLSGYRASVAPNGPCTFARVDVPWHRVDLPPEHEDAGSSSGSGGPGDSAAGGSSTTG